VTVGCWVWMLSLGWLNQETGVVNGKTWLQGKYVLNGESNVGVCTYVPRHGLGCDGRGGPAGGGEPGFDFGCHCESGGMTWPCCVTVSALVRVRQTSRRRRTSVRSRTTERLG
jgi:hypothetical protein